jgi:hypothetical protein
MVAAMIFASVVTLVTAAEPPSTSAAPSKQMRDKMASVHERMAVCLRSDKAIDECRSEMHNNCQTMMGEQGCAMMMGMGMGMRNRMKQPPAGNPDPD